MALGPLRTAIILSLCSACCAVMTACTPFEETRTHVFGDLHPPQLEALAMEGPNLIVARFNEVTSLPADSILLEPALGEVTVRRDGTRVLVETETPATVGSRYTVEATVEDEAGNTLTFMLDLTGYNPNPARVVINEFTCQGSGNHPDVVELLVTEGGNLGGVAFYAGSPREHNGALVFPSMEVATGAFVLVHLKPDGLESEVNEVDDPAAAEGKDSHPDAFDFWMAEPTGLSGNNGAISVYAYRDGPILDAVIYSNRTYDPEARYGSFGTKAAQRMIEEVVADGGWTVSGDSVRPEDAIDPEDSTATRSISRSSASSDSDTAADWHITPTSGATFGSANTDEVYAEM